MIIFEYRMVGSSGIDLYLVVLRHSAGISSAALGTPLSFLCEFVTRWEHAKLLVMALERKSNSVNSS